MHMTTRQALFVGVVEGGGEDERFRVCVAGWTTTKRYPERGSSIRYRESGLSALVAQSGATPAFGGEAYSG